MIKKLELKFNTYFDKARYPVAVCSLIFAWLVIFLLEKRISRFYATIEFLLLLVGFSLVDSKRWKSENFFRRRAAFFKIKSNAIEYTGWGLLLFGFAVLILYDLSLR